MESTPDATNAKGKTTQGGQVLHSEIQAKQLMLWRDLRGRTKRRNTKKLQDLHPTGSPHLEEIWFGGIVDLDLLSLFSVNGGTNHGGMERNQALKRSTMEERELGEIGNH